MTKQDFVDAVADRAGLANALSQALTEAELATVELRAQQQSLNEAATAVDAMLDTITAALKDGDSVTFTGFGKFSTSARAARMGVNPRTGEKVHIAATTVPKFTAGSALKSAVKGG